MIFEWLWRNRQTIHKTNPFWISEFAYVLSPLMWFSQVGQRSQTPLHDSGSQRYEARPEATAGASRSKMQSVSDSGMTTFLYSMTCALRSLFDHLHSRLDKWNKVFWPSCVAASANSSNPAVPRGAWTTAASCYNSELRKSLFAGRAHNNPFSAPGISFIWISLKVYLRP